MADKTIKVIPSIYHMEVTSHSNNHRLLCFCLECLSKSKVNKEYKNYQTTPNLSQSRICSKCGAMTTAAVYNVYGVSVANLIRLVIQGSLWNNIDSTETIKFELEPVYLNVLKGMTKHG